MPAGSSYIFSIFTWEWYWSSDLLTSRKVFPKILSWFINALLFSIQTPTKAYWADVYLNKVLQEYKDLITLECFVPLLHLSAYSFFYLSNQKWWVRNSYRQTTKLNNSHYLKCFLISGPCHSAYYQNLVDILLSLCTTGSSDRHHTLTHRYTHTDSVKRDYHIRSNFLLHSASNLRHW